MRRHLSASAASLALLLCAAGPAGAQQSCAQAVESLAARDNLDPGVPVVRGNESGPELSDKLAQSGGVIAPPLGSGGSTPTITPPPTGPNSMQTAPPIVPQPGAEGGTRAPAPQARASTDMQVEAMLSSARIAAARGDEAECRRQLDQATALLSERPR